MHTTPMAGTLPPTFPSLTTSTVPRMARQHQPWAPASLRGHDLHYPRSRWGCVPRRHWHQDLPEEECTHWKVPRCGACCHGGTTPGGALPALRDASQGSGGGHEGLPQAPPRHPVQGDCGEAQGEVCEEAQAQVARAPVRVTLLRACALRSGRPAPCPLLATCLLHPASLPPSCSVLAVLCPPSCSVGHGL